MNSAQHTKTLDNLYKEARCNRGLVTVSTWDKRRWDAASRLITSGLAVEVERFNDRYSTSRYGSASAYNRVIPGVTRFIQIASV